MASDSSGSLRADARSNRDQIVAAARALVRERGIDVPMKEVADRAGVGVGTLYRRFPDRDALVTAVAAAHLTALAEAAERARREEDAAWPALCRFLRECIADGLGATAAALEPSLHARIATDPALAATRDATVEVIARLTRQAQADGDLRADADVQDVALAMTVQIYTRPDQSRDEAVARITALLVNGLRAAK
jgi:AcrR family transcriptional regulator